MNPKNLQERAAKLCLARQRGDKRKRPRRSRSPSPKRSSSKSSSRHHRHRSGRHTSKEKERSVERPSSAHGVDAGEDLEEGELQIEEVQEDSEAGSLSGFSYRRTPVMPVSAASIERDASASSPEVRKTPPALTMPVEVTPPVDTGSYPASRLSGKILRPS